MRNVVVQNSSSPAGKDSLITSSISTIGYANITVNWGARNTTHFSDSGSYIQGFYWSADHGTTWNGISYTENANNSTWSLDNGGNSISLPAGASNQSSLQFLWMASIATSSSGTYRIDDFDVTGTVATDVPVVAGSERFADIYFINSKVIYIAMHRAFNEAVTMELYDISGKLLDRQMMNSPNLTIDALAFSKGMYFVKLSTASQQMVSRIVVK
ncbi:MAG: Por secretion system C-terminal sorting protein [Bacteroidota bacterium]|nr:Por secretion system C-terminal sorting protein [Bacteroidota bacterium]